VATLRGYYLRAWRYGPGTDQLVSNAIERDRWTADRWKTWQEERLAFILHRAATQVPFYRQLWTGRRRRGDRRSWEYLEHWPVLEKTPLRASPRAFVADDCRPRWMFHEHTSGTTGTSLDLWWSRATVRQWYALFEARCRLWYGVSRHDRWAMLGGQIVVPVHARRAPFWVRNVALHQLYMSSYHLAPDLIPAYLNELASFLPRYLLGYPSSLYEVALAALRLDRRVPMDVVVTNAEPLFPYQRRALEQAFHCPVRETYGMAEAVTAASECESGSLHLWPEVGWTEFVDGDTPATGNGPADLVCTGLLNPDMPLIRYRVGDRATRGPTGDECRCGRRLPTLRALDGRADDVLYTRDGRRVGRLDPVFKTRLPILEAQIIQETLARIRVKYVPAADYSAAAGRRLVDELQARLGDVEVVLESTDAIPRTPSGKFRAVVSRVARPEPGAAPVRLPH
jgi:phenylacetate-CoA ligase